MSPIREASADEIPNCVGEVPPPTWTTADMAWAAIGMTAPASSAAP